ncbi:unnamed protein product [Caenorhabditis nigoni]
MTTNETVFFIRGSYILLVDLESWYDNGFVTLEDEVQMFDGKKKQVCTIKDLIKNYGCRFPFRRGNDSLVVNDFSYQIKNENLISDVTKYSKGQLLGEKSMKRELDLNLSDEILRELGPMELTDYPLLNLDNEPEEDRKTGKDVEAELMKLRNSLVIKNWNKFYAEYFDFLERGYIGDDLKRTQPICRLCNNTPRHLFRHLFSKDHLENLKSHSVSRRSFEFWEYQFRECIYECGQSFGADLKTYDYIEETINEKSTEMFDEEDREIEENETISPSYSPSQLLDQQSLKTIVNLIPPVGPQRPPQPQQMPPQVQHQNEQQMGNQGSYEIDQFRPEGPPPHEPAPIMQLMPPQAPQHIQKAGIYGMQMPTAMYIPMPPPIVVRRQPVVNSHSDTVKDSRNQSQHKTSVQQQQPPPPPPQQHQQQPQPPQHAPQQPQQPQGHQEFVPNAYHRQMSAAGPQHPQQQVDPPIVEIAEVPTISPSYSRSQLLALRSLGTKVDLNLSEEILKELGRIHLIDYPLLNVDNEPEEDRITGKKVLEEFNKLRQTWVIRNWNSKYAEYFENLDKGYNGNRLKMTKQICRVCNKTPKNLMKHLLLIPHAQSLSRYSVSLRSFEFWSQKLQECLEKCGKRSGVHIFSYEQEVEQNLENPNEQKKKKMIQENEIILPSYSRSQILAERSLNSKFQLNLPEDILIKLGTKELRHYPLLGVENEPEEVRITEVETFSLSYSRSQLLAQRSLKSTIDLNLPGEIFEELGPMDRIDYPLLNVDNEPEEDRITGEKILKEFNKLRQTWVLQNWNSKYAEYFEYLDRGYKGNGLKRTQPICRICVYNGKPKNLMKHLFGSFHSGYMKNHSVSMRSFEFWSQKLQECLEKCGKLSGVYVGNYDQPIYKDQHKQKRKKRQGKENNVPSRIQVLAERLRETADNLSSYEHFLKLGNVEDEPNENRITENCELEMLTKEESTEVFDDVESEKEEVETSLLSYSRNQLLAQRSLETTVKLNLSEDILKELGLMDLIDYPLLNVDNEPEEDRITGDAISKEFHKLKQSCVVKHWNVFYAYHFEYLKRGYKGDGLKMTQPICRICNMRPAFALQHLLSYKHKENLKSHSVSLRSFEFWSQKFEECTKRCGKVASVFVCEARPID